MEDIKVLAFDTGGTVLDWHAGLTGAFAAWGAARGIERDWHALANEHRRRSLHRMINTSTPASISATCIATCWANCSTRTGSAVLRRNGRRSQSAALPRIDFRAGCRQGSEVRRDSDATSAAEPVFS